MYGFHFLVYVLCVRGIKDTQCGFKMFTRAAAATLFTGLHINRWYAQTHLLQSLCPLFGYTTCHTRVYYMSCSGILHVMLGYTTCHTWVYCMSYSGILHVILGYTACHARVYYMSCSGILHVILGYTTCHTWVYCMSYLGILHVILGIKIVLFLCCFSIGFGLLVRLILEKTFDYSFNC